jgi:hypothetical protein
MVPTAEEGQNGTLMVVRPSIPRGAAALAVLLAAASLSAAPPTPTAKPADSSKDDVAALLRRQTQELMDALAPGKAEVWRRYLDADFLSIDENGKVSDKEEILQEVTPLPAGLVGRIEVDRFEMRRHGDTAVAAAEIQEYLDYHGQNLRTRFRFLDTWRRVSGHWLLIGRHTAAVLKDPPAITLSPADLCAYAGEYRLTPEITTTIRCSEKGLVSERTGRPAATYLPEVRDLFFAPGAPRSRRIFTRDAAGTIVGFADRREGEDIQWQKIR